MMYFFIAFYTALFNAKNAVKKRISTVCSKPHKTLDETEEADKGEILWYIRKYVA